MVHSLSCSSSLPQEARAPSYIVWLFMQVGGRRTFFAGTNIFYILLRQTLEDPLGFTDDAVIAYFAAQVLRLHLLNC